MKGKLLTKRMHRECWIVFNERLLLF